MCRIHKFRGFTVARDWIHKRWRAAFDRNGDWLQCLAASGFASVIVYGVLPGTAEWAETKYSPSEPNTVPACGHRYQRCGNGCTEDIVTDGIPS